MRKLILILLLSIAMNAQNNGIYKPNSEIVNAEASIIIPIGNLSNKFDYAQSYGFWFKIGEDNGFAANVGFNALFLKNARPIDYEFNDSIYSIDSNKFGFDIGIRAIKVIPISKNQKNIRYNIALKLKQKLSTIKISYKVSLKKNLILLFC